MAATTAATAPSSAMLTTDLSDLFGAPAKPAPRAPWPITIYASSGRMMEVLPERRLGDRADSEGEWVFLRIVGPPGAYKPGASIRALLHGGPVWRHRIEGSDAIASCDAAPHIKDTLPAAALGAHRHA